ncbi:MAG: pilin [Candidatus Levyibacteriota bacterium]
MKRIIPTIATGAAYLLTTVSAFAQTINVKPPSGSIPSNTPVENFPQFLINLLFIIGLIVAVAFLIYGGIKWILSGGDKTAVESARNHIIAAIVGLVIIVGAFFIISIVFTLLGVANPLTGGQFQLPKLNAPGPTAP